MTLVVDTNILIAALLRDSVTRSLVLQPDEELLLPEHALEELERHRPEIVRRSGLSEAAVGAVLALLLDRLQVVPRAEYAEFLPEARTLVAGIDPDDAPFVALALAKKCGLWTNDRRLRGQERVPIVLTKDLAAA